MGVELPRRSTSVQLYISDIEIIKNHSGFSHTSNMKLTWEEYLADIVGSITWLSMRNVHVLLAIIWWYTLLPRRSTSVQLYISDIEIIKNHSGFSHTSNMKLTWEEYLALEVGKTSYFLD